MNQVNIIGRVGSEIEIRHTPSGKAVAEINLAVDDGFGEKKKTTWIGVTLWGPTAECAGKYVSKGDRLGISGRLTQDEWTDKTTGKTVRKTKVTCENMHLLESKKSGERQEMPPGRQQQRSMPPAPGPSADDFDNLGDVPF